jgi:hypothetical protein
MAWDAAVNLLSPSPGSFFKQKYTLGHEARMFGYTNCLCIRFGGFKCSSLTCECSLVRSFVFELSLVWDGTASDCIVFHCIEIPVLGTLAKSAMTRRISRCGSKCKNQTNTSAYHWQVPAAQSNWTIVHTQNHHMLKISSKLNSSYSNPFIIWKAKLDRVTSNFASLSARSRKSHHFMTLKQPLSYSVKNYLSGNEN